MDGQPNVLDHAWSLDFRQSHLIKGLNIDARRDPVPSVAFPAFPLLPSKFSALIDRVCAEDRSDKFPSDIPSPLNVISM
jgi:hypothetical protein